MIKKGDKVKIEYTGTFEDGKVFDSSEKHGAPLEFVVGSGMIIKGLDDAMIGLDKGAEKELKIQPEKAYGHPNPDLIKKVPKEQLPQEQELKPGMMLGVSLPTGQQIPALITEVGDKEVTIDLNSPLAGKVLNFKIKVVDITSAEDIKEECDDCKGGDSCSCG